MAEPDAPFGKTRIFVDGEECWVPASTTILDALILAGHTYLRGCGCREGDCGECAVLVRAPDGNQPATELACEVRVRPDIRVSRIPFQWNRAFRTRRRGPR